MKTIKLAALPLTFIAAAALLGGCGGVESSGSDEASATLDVPEQACEDVADALASAAQACGFDYQANHDAFVKAAAGGDCANIVSVRDKTSLYDNCIPFLRSLTCEELNDPNLQIPESCKGQLLREQ